MHYFEPETLATRWMNFSWHALTEMIIAFMSRCDPFLTKIGIISKTHGKEAWQLNGLADMALAWEDRRERRGTIEWVGKKRVQGPCCQEAPKAWSWACSPMRVAKLGKAKVAVMRSYKYWKRLTPSFLAVATRV